MSWMDTYRQKVTTAEEAVKAVQSNQRVYIGGGSGVPQQLINALINRADELRNVEIIHILHFGEAPYVEEKYHQSFRHNALFIGPNVRKAVQEGHADFTPIFLSEIPKLFRLGILPIDIAFVQLSPPDEHGFCSFGTEVGTTKPAAENASRKCETGHCGSQSPDAPQPRGQFHPRPGSGYDCGSGLSVTGSPPGESYRGA